MIRYHASWVLPVSAPPIRDGWVAVDRDRVAAYGPAGRSGPGAGPTRDGEFCMIVADAPAPSIVCIPVADTERAVSVVLPPASVESSHRPKASPQFVRYTLTAERRVVAEPIQPGVQ